MSENQENAYATLNRLAKWRVLFAGWQLGTRPKGDPEGDAVRDLRELTILLRCDMNAMTRILLEKGIMTQDEWAEALTREAELLMKDYEKRFPGVKATDDGLTIQIAEARDWMKGWKP